MNIFAKIIDFMYVSGWCTGVVGLILYALGFQLVGSILTVIGVAILVTLSTLIGLYAMWYALYMFFEYLKGKFKNV